MGYQALLFCPDEKTARTVTQVLTELEFNVESCTEPFAAVKKLMSQHFDAVVVDCDNEQNATLMFKSARNSTSNQSSLAVAVVEGQAGVAKAFRIGANLVLTKPINIEQAKGTLRVARGLLRKSDPTKPGAVTTAAFPAPVASTPARAQTHTTAIATPSPAPIQTHPHPESISPAPAATAASKLGGRGEDLVEVREEHSADISSAATPTKSAPRFITPAPQADKFLEAAVVSAAPEAKAPSASPTSVGRGAASAAAPAREREDTHAAQTLSAVPSVIESHSKTSAVVQDDSPAFVGSAPSFTFGGNVPAESSGGGKKILAAVAVVVVMAAGAYAGWTHFQGHAAQPAATPTESGPASIATPQTAKLSSIKPSATFAPTSAPKTSASLPNSQSAATTSSHISNGSADGGSNADSASDENDASVSSSAASISPKRSNSPSSAVTKTTAAVEEPLVVKGGTAPALHPKSLALDAPAPSMIGIATTGVGAPPPNFVSSGEIVPKPLLQTLNISQGVSRGLLIKKVQPTYPRNAMAVRLEGSVELLATISKTGDISHIKVQSGDSLLAKAATDAVKQWKYKPYLLNGEPVEIQTQVTINFKLPK